MDMENEKLLKSIEKIVDKKNHELAGMVQRGFSDVEKRLGGRIDGLDGRMDKLDGRMDGLGVRMGNIEGRMDNMNVEMKNIGKRMNKLEDGQEEIKNKLDGMATRLELETLRVSFEKRIRALELKIKLA